MRVKFHAEALREIEGVSHNSQVAGPGRQQSSHSADDSLIKEQAFLRQRGEVKKWQRTSQMLHGMLQWQTYFLGSKMFSLKHCIGICIKETLEVNR